MIGRSFKSVIWVAAVGGAAIGCYMLSLRVATERADLARVERQIVATKQQIRSLQTELGTRGRLSQLERWNAEVLALSAPASAQFLPNALTLARLDQRPQTVEERAPVRMASMDTEASPPAAAPVRQAKAAPAVEKAPPAAVQPAVVHRASYVSPPPAARPAKVEPPDRLDPRLAGESGAAAQAERKGAEPPRAKAARPKAKTPAAGVGGQ